MLPLTLDLPLEFDLVDFDRVDFECVPFISH